MNWKVSNVCRLFGLLSVDALNARKYLVEDACSLFAQSKVDPKRMQGDGWGIGYYVNDTPLLVKSPNPVYTEFDRFVSVVKGATSKLIVAHIRRASNPRGLPREKLISKENSQPFMYGNHIFAHNGTVNIPDEVTNCLNEWRARLKGVNDSEAYFWYIMKEMENGATFPEALQSFAETLSKLWQRSRHKYPDKKLPYIGLNTLLSDGKRLYAYCKYEKDESRQSLCFEDQPALQMAYLTKPGSLIVSSEKTSREEDWKILGSGQLMVAQISGRRVKIDVQELDFKA